MGLVITQDRTGILEGKVHGNNVQMINDGMTHLSTATGGDPCVNDSSFQPTITRKTDMLTPQSKSGRPRAGN